MTAVSIFTSLLLNRSIHLSHRKKNYLCPKIPTYISEVLFSIIDLYIHKSTCEESGPGSSVGLSTKLRAGWSGIESPVGTKFSALPDRPWGPLTLLYNGYRDLPGVKVRPGRAADHSPPSSAAVMEQ